MKRLILSATTILFSAGVIAAGASGAFFSDTETSTGNTFTAGAIDLKIDHTRQTYNGTDCGGCSNIIVSASTTQVVETGNPAVQLTFQHTEWTADLDGGHVGGPPNNGLNDGSYWIWAVDGVTNPAVDETFTFRRTFVWNGATTTATLYVASDNSHIAKVNGVTVGTDPTEQSFRTSDEDVYPVGSIIVNGLNTIEVQVRNWGLVASSPTSNPAGVLFKLIIDGECGSGFPVALGQCQLWEEKDLEDGDVFWNFSDVKPGDRGTNVISLHAFDNDAYACMRTENVENDENTPIQPELDADDTVADGIPNGELSDFMQLFIWGDTDGDGLFDGGEPTLYDDGFTNVGMTRLPLTATTTAYLGSAWCFGVQTAEPDGTFSCDGSSPANNIAQTDILTTDLVFEAVQQRNNSSFQCSNLILQAE